MNDLAERLKAYALTLGFSLVGIAPATEADGFSDFEEWLANGYAGEMDYLPKYAEARRHPRSILPSVRSVIMTAVEYGSAGEPGAYRIARYAQHEDYHDRIRAMLNRLADRLTQEAPGCRTRVVVDTAPLLERDFARRAGLGWIGKNTMLIHKRRGSFFLLGALLTDVELSVDQPHLAQHCGTCTRCLDACPTNAFVAAGILDSRKCIAYLTIELKGSIPEEQRAGIDTWIFGCDVCQEVCPWNRDRLGSLLGPLVPHAEFAAVDPVELLALDENEFRRRFRGTPLFRTKRRGVLRNAIIAVVNRRDLRALDSLRRLCSDDEPILRETACWGLQEWLRLGLIDSEAAGC